MSSRGLRIFAARAVPLVAMVILGVNICGQEDVDADFATLVIGCRDTPSRSSAVSLEVTKAWVEENALFGDLLVANHSESAIRLPRENVGLRYWDIAFLEDQNVPIAQHENEPIVVIAEGEREPGANVLVMDYCAGLPSRTYGEVLRSVPVPLEQLAAEKDIESIAPGQTVLLRAVHLESFPSAPREPRHEVRFEVRYRGWSSMTVSASTAEWLKQPLAEASSRHCSLYGGELKSNGHFLTP